MSIFSLNISANDVIIRCPSHFVRLHTDDFRDYVTLTMQNTGVEAFYRNGEDIEVNHRYLPIQYREEPTGVFSLFIASSTLIIRYDHQGRHCYTSIAYLYNNTATFGSLVHMCKFILI